jgi:hypothetical protein
VEAQAAEQQQTAAVEAQSMYTRRKKFFFPHQKGVFTRAAEGQSLGINFPGPSPLPPVLEAGAQQRARNLAQQQAAGNEINTAMTLNRFLTCGIVVF